MDDKNTTTNPISPETAFQGMLSADSSLRTLCALIRSSASDDMYGIADLLEACRGMLAPAQEYLAWVQPSVAKA